MLQKSSTIRCGVIEAEQLFATNILEWIHVAEKEQHKKIIKLLMRYNEIIAKFETDPSF
jgi:hypothetical protein